MEIRFNAARESSTASSHILWVICLSGQYTIKECYKETNMPYISWALCWSWIESDTKKASMNCFILESYSIQQHILL